MKQIFLMLLACMVSLSTMAKDDQKVVFTTRPQMHCATCENKVRDILRFEKGVKDIQTSVSDQTVVITYNPKKTSPERLKEALQKRGYAAEQLKEGERRDLDPNEECPEM